MRPITRFSLERHSGPYERWPLKSRLIDEGRLTEHALPGYDVLHQFELDDGFLIITDYDCPFEEATCFSLLDRSLRVRASRTLGAPYASFLLDRVEVLDARRLIATFYEEDHWLLTIRDRPLPLLQSRLGLRRYQPQTA